MKVAIAGIGAWGPGFSSWQELAEQLNGEADAISPGEEVQTARPAPECIPPRERRRAPLSVKLAVAVAEQACAAGDILPEEPVCVFASGMGDMDITDYMCRTLASDHPMVSPTKFHNSVHNAPVGYWSISQGAKKSSNAVAGYEHTVPASLLEAATQCVTEGVPVLWASQDIKSPAPFQAIAPISDACAFALLMLPEPRSGREAMMALSLEPGDAAWAPSPLDAFDDHYENNPTARLLPLLAMLGKGSGQLAMPLNGHLALELAISGRINGA